MRLTTAITVAALAMHAGCAAPAPKSVAGDGAQLRVQILEEPAQCRAKASLGKFLLVHFESATDDSSTVGVPGTFHHSTRKTGLPIDIAMDPQNIIPGWVKGLEGVCEGAKVELIVPPSLGEPTDPPGQTLRYEIEVLQVSDTPLEGPNVFARADADGDGHISVDEFANFFNNVNDGKPIPFALFHREDVNQDHFVDWYEFTGPKGTAPPSGMKPKDTPPRPPADADKPATLNLMGEGASPTQFQYTTEEDRDKTKLVIDNGVEKTIIESERGKQAAMRTEKKEL